MDLRRIEGKRDRRTGVPRHLRIAQVAPLYESVPPKLYGGTERVVAYLVEALIARGHQVTLFASGDSNCRAPLKSGWPKALRLTGLSNHGAAYQLPMLSEVYENAAEFDVIHSHLDYWGFPFARLVDTPTIVTLHGRLDLPEIHPIYRAYRDVPVVSISDAQRRHLQDLDWIGTAYHGVPRNLLRFGDGSGNYLAFLGRISPEKRPDLAIEIARRVGIPLKIAAKVDAVDRDYFEIRIKPMLAGPGVEYIGEISDAEKEQFLGDALALLFPIDWPEPFGLAMIESLACGTPVITRPCGSVPEIIRHGVTGFVASEVGELVRCVEKVRTISRAQCRREFESRFTSDVMAATYERLYLAAIASAGIARGYGQSRVLSAGVSPGVEPTEGSMRGVAGARHNRA